MTTFKPAGKDQLIHDDPGLLSLFPKSINDIPRKPPHVEGNHYLLDGLLHKFTGPSEPVVSAIVIQNGTKIKVSEFAKCNQDAALEALNAAYRAWNHGAGEWPRMSMHERASRMGSFLQEFRGLKQQLVELLMWDICKSQKDASDEVDRTIDYIQDSINHALDMDKTASVFQTVSGVAAQIKRLPIGVVLASGPFNYPLNECYTTFIPALLTGNTVILRVPRNGATPHFPTLPLFAKYFPPGTINILTGSGREIMTPIIQDGRVDYLAFIGQSSSANAIIRNHPATHRLHTTLQMDAKDCAVVLKDADVEEAATQIVTGAFSFNGQRCTAIKMVWVHESIAHPFVQKVVEKVDALKVGMPWEEGVMITPICESDKPDIYKGYIADAVKKGAHILNHNGGRFGKSLVSPTVIGPVTEDMDLYSKEQFGPILPIATYSSLEVGPLRWINESKFGLQSAVFGYDPKEVGLVLDTMAYQVGRVNLNSPDKRGPDVLPFGGKKDSGMGIMNAKYAVRGFTVESIVATEITDKRNVEAMKRLVGVSSVVHSTEGIKAD